jgi:hypothetical protein
MNRLSITGVERVIAGLAWNTLYTVIYLLGICYMLYGSPIQYEP